MANITRSANLQAALAFGLGALATLALPTPAAAQRIIEFDAHSIPFGIAAGPDGALWFTEVSATAIGRITLAGDVTEFLVPTGNCASSSASRPGRTARCGSPKGRQQDRAHHHRGEHHGIRRPHVHSGPSGITAGPDGALWFTEPDGNKIGRITTAGVVTEFTVPTTGSNPSTSRPGRTARCGSPKKTATRSGGSPPAAPSPNSPIPRPSATRRHRGGAGRRARGSPSNGQQDRAHHHRGRHHQFAIAHRRQPPAGITAGPDGALWFTEQRQQDRAHHDRRRRHRIHRARRHHRPMASRPGRTARCGSPRSARNKIGRITTAGASPNSRSHGRQPPRWHHGGAGRRAVVHRNGRRTRSGASPPPAPLPSSRSRRPAATPSASPRDPTARCGSPKHGANKIGRITTAGVITEFPVADRPVTRRASRRDRTARCGSPKIQRQQDRAHHDRRRGHRIPDSDAGSTPVGITAGPDGALWFTESKRQQDRAHHDRRRHHGILRSHRRQRYPSASRLGRTARLWFTEIDGNKIGRITTAGVITEFVIPSANSSPIGIATGPDGALWFTEQQCNKIGRITTAGIVTEFTIPTSTSIPRYRGGPDSALWFTEAAAIKSAAWLPAHPLSVSAVPPTGDTVTGGGTFLVSSQTSC